ncbi:MAG: ORF6N domain-containing protein [Candidatus Woesearchaeota archaeon]
MNRLTICQNEIEIKECNNERVVTFKDIDNLHQRPKGTAKRNFNNNKIHFLEKHDYFFLKPTDIEKYEFRTFKIPNRGIYLFTESGYLMLVKSFTDDLAWKVQRELVNSYFRSKEKSKQIDSIITAIEHEAIDNIDKMNMLEVYYLDKLQKTRPKSKSYPSLLRMAEIQYNNYRRIIQHNGENELIKQLEDKIKNLEKEIKTFPKKIVNSNVTEINSKKIIPELIPPAYIARQLNINSITNCPHSRFINFIAYYIGLKSYASLDYEDEYLKIVDDMGEPSPLYKPKGVELIKMWWEEESIKHYNHNKYKKDAKYGRAGDIKEIYYSFKTKTGNKNFYVYTAKSGEKHNIDPQKIKRNKYVEMKVS